MATSKSSSEQSRERLVALVLLLERASERGALTQDEIVRELRVDESGHVGSWPKKVLAYQGSDVAIRQKFERDKSRIRDLGFEISTVIDESGTVRYAIDPASVYAPRIDFTEDESRVIALALAVSGFGRSGAFGVFSDVPAPDSSRWVSHYFNPVMRALKQRRRLRFGYRSSSDRIREVEPLLLESFDGIAYLVGRASEDQSLRGYRLSRFTSMPVVQSETFEVDGPEMERASEWRPQWDPTTDVIHVIVETNSVYSTLLQREFPKALGRTDGERWIVDVPFDDALSAKQFVVGAAERVTLLEPEGLKEELRVWFREVNRGHIPDISHIKFDDERGTDVLGQTLQLLHAVYASSEGLKISELSQRFFLAPALVRSIMDRLVSLEATVGSRDGTFRYLASVVKECADWDDPNDDSLYVADFSDLPEGHTEPPVFMWRDLFELNVALREASRLYHEEALWSAIEKIEDVTKSFVRINSTEGETYLPDVEAVLNAHEQIKIMYWAASESEPTLRSIEPREIRVLNGHSYVRAFCHSREGWRTFRIDRITEVLERSRSTQEHEVDSDVNWLTNFTEDGDEVVILLESSLRWHFETVPGAKWAEFDDGRLIVKFRLLSRDFLDRLLVRAGPGAVVVTRDFVDAGRELAARLLMQM